MYINLNNNKTKSNISSPIILSLYLCLLLWYIVGLYLVLECVDICHVSVEVNNENVTLLS